MNKLSIKARVLLGYALPMVLFVGFTAWLTLQLGQIRQSLGAVSGQSVEYALRATEMDKQVVQIQQFLSDVSATRARDGLDDGFKSAQDNYDAFLRAAGLFEKHFSETGDQASLQALSAIRSSAERYYAAGLLMAKAYVSGGPEAGNKLMTGFDAASEDLQKALAPFVKAQVVQMKGDLSASAAKADQVSQTGLIIVALALALAALVAWWVTRSITLPLTRALGVARRVAAGELDTRIDADASEIGQLMAPLAKMQGTLQQFEAAQQEMTRQHAAGMLDHVMPVQQLEGAYRAMGESINDLVRSHIAVKMKIVEVVTGYTEGRFDVAMDRLPGQKARITEAIDKVQASMRSATLAARENLRIRNALDKCSTNVMIANADNDIVYMNETVMAMMRRNEGELRKTLPQFDAQRLIGQSIDLFHKNPAHQRGLLQGLRNVYRTQIGVGSLSFSLSASPIVDAAGERVGTVVEWADRTLEVAIEREVAELVRSAAQGDFSGRLALDGKTGFFAALSGGMNELMGTSEQGLGDVAELLAAFARGDLTHRIERDYAGLFGKVKESGNQTAEQLTRVIGEVRAAADSLTGAAPRLSAPAARQGASNNFRPY